MSILAAVAMAASVFGLKNVPGVGRFAESRSIQQGVEVFRAGIWKQAPAIIFGKTTITHPTDGRVDRWRALRAWIGHGSETLDSVLPFYYQVEVGEFVLENRFHNLVWDLWFSIGLVGLVAFLAFLLFLFSAAYRALDFIGSGTAAAWFLVCNAIFVALGISIFTGLLGIGFAGVGLLGGLVVGLLLFAIGSSLWKRADSRHIHGDHILIIALLAALTGHLIDTGFAFVTGSTAVLFWIYSGLLVAILRRTKDRQSPESPTAVREAITSAVLICIGLVSFFVATIHQISFQSFSVVDLIVRSLCDIEGTEDRYSLLCLPVALFWIGASLAFVLDEALRGSCRKATALFVRILSISGGVGIILLLLQCAQNVHIGAIPRRWASESTALQSSLGYERLVVATFAILGVLVLVFAWSRQRAKKNSLGSPLGIVAAVALFFAALFGISMVALKPLRAIACCEWGEALEQNHRRELSIAIYERAIQLDAWPFLYRALLSEACLQAANEEEDPTKWESYLSRAERSLLDARRINDLNRTSFLLARLYLLWAAGKSEPMKTVLNRKALTASREALVFEPHTPPVALLNNLAEQQVNNR